jgi:hypothetical protein
MSLRDTRSRSVLGSQEPSINEIALVMLLAERLEETPPTGWREHAVVARAFIDEVLEIPDDGLDQAPSPKLVELACTVAAERGIDLDDADPDWSRDALRALSALEAVARPETHVVIEPVERTR